MTTTVTRVLIILGAVLAVGGVDWQIVQKSYLRDAGQVLYLELGSFDPRSLIQGDYMGLNFRVAGAIASTAVKRTETPVYAILHVDDRRIGQFVRLQDGLPLQPGEVRLRFRMRKNAAWIGTNAFFFQEGQADRYSAARYGEFRIDSDGNALLVELADENLNPLTRQPR